jgi:hypothetical protein
VSATGPARLSGKERTALAACFLVIVLLVAGYWAWPPSSSKTTTKRDAAGHTVSTTVEEQTKVGDAVLLGGLGFAALLALTAMTAGRLKLTAPGGGAVEVASVAATAQDTIDKQAGGRAPGQRARGGHRREGRGAAGQASRRSVGGLEERRRGCEQLGLG